VTSGVAVNPEPDEPIELLKILRRGMKMALILIVDDDELVRTFLNRLMEKNGHQTLVAENGKKAVEQYQQNQPDLVITDIVMPEQEGIETILKLKRINPEVKIIALSGGGKIPPSEYLRMATKLGAAKAFMKPIDNSRLMAAVDELLSNRKGG